MAEELRHGSKPVTVPVQATSDVRRARDAAFGLARELAFTERVREEIALVVTELATNLLRHAKHGVITVSATESGPRRGILIQSDDEGPGIADIERAMTDGYSTAGGLGMGLGSVNRLMDDVEIGPRERGGLHVACHRWLRPQEAVVFERRLAVGVASRPRRLSEENGDSFLMKQWEGSALVGVIDGLGHGPFAHRASQTARHYVETHYDQPLQTLFRGAGRACRATRGVVMALAHFDFALRKIRIANIGNVEVRLVNDSENINPILRRGIVGLNAPEAVVSEFPWGPKSFLIMHSDGISTRWKWSDFEATAKDGLNHVAQRFLQALAKPEDDATVLVAGNAS
jgi:anti-sigma regulatory factor (Ser/Thr protein kinase)/serine/threonine protein phosphatase PrpC